METQNGTVVGRDGLGYTSFDTFRDSGCGAGQSGKEGIVCDHMKEAFRPQFRSGNCYTLHNTNQDTRVHSQAIYERIS